jgi:hypothetical protein
VWQTKLSASPEDASLMADTMGEWVRPKRLFVEPGVRPSTEGFGLGGGYRIIGRRDWRRHWSRVGRNSGARAIRGVWGCRRMGFLNCTYDLVGGFSAHV